MFLQCYSALSVLMTSQVPGPKQCRGSPAFLLSSPTSLTYGLPGTQCYMGEMALGCILASATLHCQYFTALSVLQCTVSSEVWSTVHCILRHTSAMDSSLEGAQFNHLVIRWGKTKWTSFKLSRGVRWNESRMNAVYRGEKSPCSRCEDTKQIFRSLALGPILS